jgi:hypothetical protein
MLTVTSQNFDNLDLDGVIPINMNFTTVEFAKMVDLKILWESEPTTRVAPAPMLEPENADSH